MPVEFRTGVMRLIEGDVFVPNTKNYETGEPLTDKAGNPRQEFYIGLAAKKGDPGWAEVEGKLRAEATTGWSPKGIVPANVKDFSWKFYDGDGHDKYGKPLADKNPAKAGHMVLRMTNGFPPQVYARAALLPENHPGRQGVTIPPGSNGPLVQLGPQDAALTKKGNYFRAFGDAKSNDNLQSPGIYVNVQGVELVGFGEEIVSANAKSGDQMFGDEPVPTVAAPAPTASAPAPTASPSSAPAPAPAYEGFMPPAPAPAPTGPQLTPAAIAAWPDGKTVDQWTAAGWTLDALKSAGYVA